MPSMVQNGTLQNLGQNTGPAVLRCGDRDYNLIYIEIFQTSSLVSFYIHSVKYKADMNIFSVLPTLPPNLHVLTHGRIGQLESISFQSRQCFSTVYTLYIYKATHFSNIYNKRDATYLLKRPEHSSKVPIFYRIYLCNFKIIKLRDFKPISV